MRRVFLCIFLSTSACAAIAGFGDRPSESSTTDTTPDSSTTDDRNVPGGDAAPEPDAPFGVDNEPGLFDETFANKGSFAIDHHADALAVAPGSALVWAGSELDPTTNKFTMLTQAVTSAGVAIDGAKFVPLSNGNKEERARVIVVNTTGGVGLGGVAVVTDDNAQAAFVRTSPTYSNLTFPSVNPAEGASPVDVLDIVASGNQYGIAVSGGNASNRVVYSGTVATTALNSAPRALVPTATGIVGATFSNKTVTMFFTTVGAPNPDPSFGSGQATFTVSGAVDDVDLVINSDAIKVAGTSGGGQNLFVQPMSATGALNGNRIERALPYVIKFRAAALQNGKLLVAGCRLDRERPFIARYSIPAIDPDLTFGARTPGSVTIEGSFPECVKGIAVDESNKIVALLGSDGGPDRIVRLAF